MCTKITIKRDGRNYSLLGKEAQDYLHNFGDTSHFLNRNDSKPLLHTATLVECKGGIYSLINEEDKQTLKALLNLEIDNTVEANEDMRVYIPKSSVKPVEYHWIEE